MRLLHMGAALAGCAALAAVMVTPGVASAQQEQVEWVALGDSYTAGLFVGEPQPPLGDAARDGCDRTTNSYPDLVGRRLAATPPTQPVSLTDVSCGAAVISDIAQTSQTPVSPVERPDGGWPAVPPQVERAAVGEQTDLVTVGIGGNSMPLAKILTSCLLLAAGQDDEATPCRDAYERDGFILDPESIRDKYARVFREYVDMLERVHDQAPNAKVITVGYPAIFPEDASGCDRSNPAHLVATINDSTLSATRGDIAWLHDVVVELNALIEDATDLVDYNYVYVDTFQSSVGHDLCQPADVKWVEGVCGQAAEYWPTAVNVGSELLPFEVQCTDGLRATIVHPNGEGHINTANQVEQAVRSALPAQL